MEIHVTHSDYQDALVLVQTYERQEKLKRSKLFKYDQEIKLIGDTKSYYFKEYDVENDTLLIANSSDDDHIEYNDYWIDFERIDLYKTFRVINYELNQKVRYGNEDVVHYFKQYSKNCKEILISTEVLEWDIDYEQYWVSSDMIHDNYKVRKGSK